MGFFLSYGGYVHSENEVSVSVNRTTLKNQTGQPYGEQHAWTIEGRLIGDDTAAVIAAARALVAAYSRHYLDFRFYDSSGNTAYDMKSAGSLTGVIIDEPPSFPEGTGAQLSTFLDYRIVAHCDYGLTPGANPLKAFTETLAFSGGGPRRAVVECANAEPQEQILSLRTAYRCSQSGSAVGLLAYPPIPGPIFPGKEEVVGGDVQIGSPKYANGLYTDWPVSWSYSFISAVQLVGLPNVWPAGG